MSAPRSGRNGMAPLPIWADLEEHVPRIVATMRRCLQQIACVLRPGSVTETDISLRAFAAFLVEEQAPRVTSVADVARGHIEDYKPWLARRPGQNKPRLTAATIAHHLGALRMFSSASTSGLARGARSGADVRR